MSLNEIVDPNYKPWLDPVVNIIKVDGDWSYKESDKTAGDNLVLDSNLVAQWIPLPGNTPYGNAIAVRPASQNITNISSTILLNYLAPFAPFYTFNTNTNHITINQPGTYLLYANINYNTNVANSVFIEFEKQSDINPNQFNPVVGSKIRSYPGTTVFTPLNNLKQQINLCTAGVVRTIAPNRQVRIRCSTSGSSIPIVSEYSSFLIVKVSSV